MFARDGLIKEIRTTAGALASDNVVIAYTLNSEFIVPVLYVVEIPVFPDYNVLSALFLTPISVVEVMHFIKQLPNKRSCGYDGIPIFLFKKLAALIAAPLAHIISSSFEKG
jgi:hypothetical protein